MKAQEKKTTKSSRNATVTFSFRFYDEETYPALQRAADSEGSHVSVIIRRAIRRELEQLGEVHSVPD